MRSTEIDGDRRRSGKMRTSRCVSDMLWIAPPSCGLLTTPAFARIGSGTDGLLKASDAPTMWKAKRPSSDDCEAASESTGLYSVQAEHCVKRGVSTGALGTWEVALAFNRARRRRWPASVRGSARRRRWPASTCAAVAAMAGQRMRSSGTHWATCAYGMWHLHSSSIRLLVGPSRVREQHGSVRPMPLCSTPSL